MTWLPLVLILLPALAYATYDELRRRRNLRRFWDRPSTAPQWTQAFPDAADYDIRTFLRLVTDAYGFSPKRADRFAPHDTLSDIYRAVYPVPGGGDQGETECLSLLIQRHYGVTPDPFWTPDLTLGALFRYARTPQSAGNPTAPRAAHP